MLILFEMAKSDINVEIFFKFASELLSIKTYSFKSKLKNLRKINVRHFAKNSIFNFSFFKNENNDFLSKYKSLIHKIYKISSFTHELFWLINCSCDKYKKFLFYHNFT